MNIMREHCRAAGPVLAALILLAAVASFAEEAAPPAKQAPEFTLLNVKTGKMVSLSEYKGKVVLLDFWATWCVPCRKAIKGYEELFKEKHQEGFVVLAVSVDKRVKKLKDFVDKRPVSYPMLHDPDKKAMKAYGVFRIPTTFIIDRTGAIKYKYVGGGENMEKIIKEKVEELLK